MYVLVLAFLLIAPQQDEIVASSDRLERTGSIVTYTGDVVITYRDMQVEADTIVYDQSTQMLEASNGVTFVRGEERLTGRRLEINLDTTAGVLTEATGALGPSYLIQAAEAYRLEDGRYELFDATVTTCDDEGNPGWEFHTPRTTIDPNSSVQAVHSVLRIKGVPVFYMPYISAPVATRPRSSGFLTPQTSTSTTKGRSVSESFYYVINRSADLTVTGEYFTLRGLAGAARFRAVPNDRSRIEVDSFFADDRKGQGGKSARILAYTERDDLRVVADMNLVSSFVFRQVFEEGFDVISSPTERSRAFATYNTPGVSYNLLYTRQGTFFVDQPTAIIRKLPSIEMAVHARPVGDLPLYFSFDGSASGLHRRDAVITSSAFVGRLDIHPRLEIPVLRAGAFNWSHQLGVRETFYSDQQNVGGQRDSLNRVAFDYGFVFSGPQLEKQYSAWKHVIEPQIEYRYVTGVDEFGNTLLIDDTDLFVDTNEVRYRITNRFFTDREVLSWTLTQKYYANQTFGGALVSGRDTALEPLLDLTGFGFADEPRRFSPLVSLLRFSPRAGTSTDLQIDYDTVRRQFRSAGIIGRYQAGPTFSNLAYFFTRRSLIQLPNNQIRATLGFGDSNRLGLNGAVSFAYNVDQAILQAATAQLSYNTDCYGLHLAFMQFDLGPRRESRLRFSFSLKDLGAIGNLGQDSLF
jgi:LPS-assembly protein